MIRRLTVAAVLVGVTTVGGVAATGVASAANVKNCGTTTTQTGTGNSGFTQTTTTTQTSACNSNSDTGFVDQGTSNPGGNLPPGQQ